MIDDVIKRICKGYSLNDKELYANRFRLIYGNLFKNNPENLDALCDEIVAVETSKTSNGLNINCPQNGAELMGLYSDLAYELAIDSHKSGRIYQIAIPLKLIMTELYESGNLNNEDREVLRRKLSEAILDFNYATGNHKISSIRLSHLFY